MSPTGDDCSSALAAAFAPLIFDVQVLDIV
jgi:hypothetical protein